MENIKNGKYKKIRSLFVMLLIGLLVDYSYFSGIINVKAQAQTVNPSCPTGYTRSGSKCTKTTNEWAGQYKCPSEYTQPGGSYVSTCVKVTYKEMSPEFKVKEGDGHVSTVYTCPNGEKVANNGKTDSGEAYVCKITTTTTGTKVYKKNTKTASVTCPDNYTYNSSTDLCHLNGSTTSNSSSSSSSSSSSTSSSTSKKVTITCPSTTFKVDAGKSKTIGIKITNSTISKATVTSSNKKIATVKKVTKNGKKYIQVTGVKAGSTKIKIKVGTVSKTCKVTVNKKNTETEAENEAENTTTEGISDISEIIDETTDTTQATSQKVESVTCKDITVTKGSTVKPSYTITPTNATNKKVTITVKSTKIAKYTNSKIKGVAVGKTTYTVKSKSNTSAKATCNITVKKKVAVSKVTVTPSKKTMTVGSTLSLIANVSPSNATNKKVTYKSSNTKVATVSSTGQITAKKAGTVTITVTSSSDKTKTGKTTITVKKASTKTNTSAIETESISIPSTKTISVDSRATIKVTASPTNALNTATFKSSNTKIVTVDSDGRITGHATGTATITATSTNNPKATATCKVTVTKKIAVSSLKVSPTTQTMYVGDKKTIVATISPSNVYNKAVTYKSSNTKVATVSSTGQVTAIKKGTATITATSRSDATKTAKTKITVKAASKASEATVKSLTVKEAVSIAVGNKTKLSVTSSSKTVAATSLTFKSSNTKVATVDTDGTIVGKASGTATITITSKKDSTIKTTCIVTVTKKVNVKSVKLDYKNVIVLKNDSIKLSTSITPTNASNKSVTWTSSNTKVATVDTDGTIVGKASGTATITATSKSDATKKASISVKVVERNNKNKTIATPNIKLKSFTFDTLEVNLISGNSKTMVVNKNPSNSNDIILWKSSNTKIATVNSKGKITGYKSGTTIITGYSQYNSTLLLNVKVNVSKKADGTEETPPNSKIYPAPDIKMEKEYITINGIKGVKLTFKNNIKNATKIEAEEIGIYDDAREEDSNETFSEAFSKSLLKKSSFSFNIKGTSFTSDKVTFKITAYYKDGKSKTKIITTKIKRYTNISKLKIKLNKENISFDSINKSYTLKPIITPKKYINTVITWSSSNEDVVTVDSYGKVTSRGVGTATITAKGEDLEATCKVEVKDNQDSAINNTNINYQEWKTSEDGYDYTTLKVNETTYVPYIDDSEFIPSNYIYVLADSSVASVDETGNITALKTGTTYLKVISKLDGNQYNKLLMIKVE